MNEEELKLELSKLKLGKTVCLNEITLDMFRNVESKLLEKDYFFLSIQSRIYSKIYMQG